MTTALEPQPVPRTIEPAPSTTPPSAAAPEPPGKPTKDSLDRVRRMREEFDKWNRKRGRDDFERDR
jgi:hypothetical protein